MEPPPEVVPAKAVPPPAPPAEEELAAAGPGHAQGELAEAGPQDARGELAEAGPRDAEGELAGAGRGDAEPDAAEVAQAAPGEAGGRVPDAAEDSRDVSRLAVAGIIVGIIALVAAAAGVLAVITHGFRPKTVITYRPAAVFGLRPGECVNSAPNGLSVTVVSCAAPHDAEVFARFSLPASAWPGAAAARQAAGQGCASRLGGYLNPAFAGIGLTEEYVYPDQAAWLAGERTVVCEVRATNGPLSGSVGKAR
ncbi:MAG: septum formation family protein [Actinobacteria bacterium]|nr:septum formation family protein [Actinomycetota bacterium]